MNSESWKAWKIGEIGRIVTGKTPSTKIEKNFGNKYPYTKIEFVIRDMGVTRVTVASYLDALAKADLLDKQKIWRSNYYITLPLFNLLQGNLNG